jgi:hypothetical protein|tara:strand:- start:4036 stop:4890 length:855 start_codon:yes stop_codon:yes gene_type:complete
MNKLLLFLFFYLPFVLQFSSQNNDPIVENTELRKVRFGLYAQGSLCWLTPEQQKIYSRGNFGLGYGWGLDVEINFNPTTTLRTGINFSTFKAGINYYDEDLDAIHKTYYLLNDEENFIPWGDETPPDGELYHLLYRKYTVNYVNIPIVLKLKTSEIGYFTYYGEFGGSIGLKTGALVDDRIIPFSYSSDSLSPIIDRSYILEDIDISKGTQPVRFGLNLGAGAEYSLSGTTALFFQLNWNYFVTNQLTKESNEEFLRKQVSTSFERVGIKALPGNIVLSFGILF